MKHICTLLTLGSLMAACGEKSTDAPEYPPYVSEGVRHVTFDLGEENDENCEIFGIKTNQSKVIHTMV